MFFKILTGAGFAYLVKGLIDLILYDATPSGFQMAFSLTIATIFMLILFVASFDPKITSE